MMNQEDELNLKYDDDASIAFIQNYLPQDMKGKFSDDELIYIIDLIYEFYEKKGFIEDDEDDGEVLIDEEELIEFVITQAKKNNVGNFTPEEMAFIVQGELAYCDTLSMFY